MNLEREWIPYLWAIPLGGVAWYETHTNLGVNPWFILVLILIGYSTTLIFCQRTPVSAHQFGHLILFEAATLLGFAGSNLECVGGIVYLFMIAGTAAVVVAAALIRLLVCPWRAYCV